MTRRVKITQLLRLQDDLPTRRINNALNLDTEDTSKDLLWLIRNGYLKREKKAFKDKRQFFYSINE